MALAAHPGLRHQVICEDHMNEESWTIADDSRRVTDRDMDQMLTPESSLPDRRAAPSLVNRKTLTWR
jgi:hypothetical protein